MDSAVSLQSVLVLLASAVVAVALCRSLRLPPIVGYLAAGVALGPHAAGLLSNRDELRHLADFGAGQSDADQLGNAFRGHHVRVHAASLMREAV